MEEGAAELVVHCTGALEDGRGFEGADGVLRSSLETPSTRGSKYYSGLQRLFLAVAEESWIRALPPLSCRPSPEVPAGLCHRAAGPSAHDRMMLGDVAPEMHWFSIRSGCRWVLAHEALERAKKPSQHSEKQHRRPVTSRWQQQ